MNIDEAYQIMSKESGINVGDTVKVIRKAQSYEMGWQTAWDPYMDEMIGKEYTVSEVFDGVYHLSDLYWFPFFVLEKIKSKPAHEFKPFDRVLVRDEEDGTWKVDLFSHFKEVQAYKYQCLGNRWDLCIPYEGNENLVGTTDSPQMIN